MVGVGGTMIHHLHLLVFWFIASFFYQRYVRMLVAILLEIEFIPLLIIRGLSTYRDLDRV